MAPAEHRQTWVLPAVIAAAATVVVATLGVSALILSRSREATVQPAQTTAVQPTNTYLSAPAQPANPQPPTESPSTSEQPVVAPPVPAAKLPSTARACPTLFGTAGNYTKSAAGDSVTSCEFAEAVRVSYGRSGPGSSTPRVVNAYSTVTGKWYPMTCVANAAVATCAGGDDAVVYAY
jgi:hypothetical protein